MPMHSLEFSYKNIFWSSSKFIWHDSRTLLAGSCCCIMAGACRASWRLVPQHVDLGHDIFRGLMQSIISIFWTSLMVKLLLETSILLWLTALAVQRKKKNIMMKYFSYLSIHRSCVCIGQLYYSWCWLWLFKKFNESLERQCNVFWTVWSSDTFLFVVMSLRAFYCRVPLYTYRKGPKDIMYAPHGFACCFFFLSFENRANSLCQT